MLGMTGSFLVVEGATYFIEAQMQATNDAAFFNTGRFRFPLLPQGVTFISESGVFLTQTTASVPEPASWALLIVGFGLTGAVLRRRRVVAA